MPGAGAIVAVVEGGPERTVVEGVAGKAAELAKGSISDDSIQTSVRKVLRLSIVFWLRGDVVWNGKTLESGIVA